MKAHKFFLFTLAAVIILQCAPGLYSQRINPKKLIEAYGQNARVYFLSANRPSYSISAYTAGRGNFEFSTGVSFGEDYTEVPLDITYGISDNTDIFAGINVFTQSYDFEENKISGLGDAGIGARYNFHESDFFSHALQIAFKIPTASKSSGLGTGKVDFHFGLGHSYYAGRWGYDAGVELNLLHRRDFPGTGTNVPPVLRNAIDSIKKAYDYTYEPEIGFSLTPAVYPASNVFVYVGLSFTRNTRLDYNTAGIFAGAGYSPSPQLILSAGSSYGLEEEGTWGVSLGLSYIIARKK